jgi:hypothetical protein
MNRVYGRIPHNLPHTMGDCFRACVASILELPYEEVPHFMDPKANDPAKFIHSKGWED